MSRTKNFYSIRERRIKSRCAFLGAREENERISLCRRFDKHASLRRVLKDVKIDTRYCDSSKEKFSWEDRCN